MAHAPLQIPVDPRPTSPTVQGAIEVGLAFDRAAGSRLLAAERLILSLPAILGDGLESVELHLSENGGLAAVARIAPGGPPERLARKLAFWCARAGARALPLAALHPGQRALFDASLKAAGRRLMIPAAAIDDEVPRFFTEAGAPPLRRSHPEPLPVLELDVDGPAWESSRWDPAAHTLFVASSLAPPEGDCLVLRLYSHDQPPRCASARVAAVRSQARPGEPAGFTLALGETTDDLLQSISRQVPSRPARDTRAAPRFAVDVPAGVAVAEADAERRLAQSAPGVPAPFVLAEISMVGGLIRTETPFPVGAALHVAAELPTGDSLRVAGRVTSAGESAMGIAWITGGEANLEVGAMVDRIAAMRRRVLVVDDDALLCQLLTESLEARGFEVLTASDGERGLSVLMNEILSLDMLVADLRMPHMDGESLLKTVRSAGGEAELTIVLISGKLDPALESKLLREGADAVLPKALGPRILAQAAAAVMDRKRALGSK